MPGAGIRGLLQPWGGKMGWDPEIPICLRVVYGSFHATVVELVHCYRLYGPVKAENICSLTLDRKRFADP